MFQFRRVRSLVEDLTLNQICASRIATNEVLNSPRKVLLAAIDPQVYVSVRKPVHSGPVLQGMSNHEAAFLFPLILLVCQELVPVSFPLPGTYHCEKFVEELQVVSILVTIRHILNRSVSQPQRRFEELERNHTTPLPVQNRNKIHVIVQEKIENFQVPMDQNERALVEVAVNLLFGMVAEHVKMVKLIFALLQLRDSTSISGKRVIRDL